MCRPGPGWETALQNLQVADLALHPQMEDWNLYSLLQRRSDALARTRVSWSR